jgi:hypothetical protein
MTALPGVLAYQALFLVAEMKIEAIGLMEYIGSRQVPTMG